MATKSYDHAVIYNGEFYPANTPIVVENDVTTPEQANEGETDVTIPEQANEGAEKAVKANANKRTGRKPKTANTTD